ncbi:hypothetical protein PT300_11670 [Enterobacteriaceae bacterium ESL0689]|nr:hypothetical protein [Enterobacteriaceae bacterium ESL0689]MDF7681204.1 hypothetical protein [Enterobacteriaceae bacterium ESL0689]
MVEPLTLTIKQIRELAKFAEENSQPAYTITDTVIPEFESTDGGIVPEYSGLVAYSESGDSVLELGE